MRFLTFAAALLITLTGNASAQSTGASFGGGSWGSSSSSGSSGSSSSWGSSSSSGSSWGSSSSSGSSWGSSSSSGSSSWDSSGSSYSGSSGSSSYSYSGGSGGGGSNSFFCAIIALLIVAGFFSLSLRSSTRSARGMTYIPAPAPTRIDVSAIMLGIDWRAREFVQAKLKELAQGDTKSKGGLMRLIRETVETLHEAKLAWLYAGAYNAMPMPEQQAQGEFVRITGDLRSRFRHELVRNVDGTTRTAATPALQAREEEGEGVVVVSIVIAAKGGLGDLRNPRDARTLSGILRSFTRLDPFQLVAMEVIWSPAAEDDRMSTAELEVLYPDLRRIDEQTIAGRYFCAYCSGPYAAELQECPHCGAPKPLPGPVHP